MKKKHIVLIIVLLVILSPIISLPLKALGIHSVINALYIVVALLGVRELANKVYDKNQLVVMAVFFLFIVMYLFSYTYSASTFKDNKAFLLIVCFFFFLAGRYLGNNFKPIFFFKSWFYLSLIFNIVMAILLVPFVMSIGGFNGEVHSLFREQYEGIMVPDYLTIAFFSYSPLFYIWYHGSKKEKILSLIIFAIQFLFTARGAFLFFFIILFFNEIVLKLKFLRVKYLSILLLFMLPVIFFSEDIPVIYRLTHGNISARESQYRIAIEHLGENIFFGDGLNETGIALYRNDIKLSYPHNVFLEVLIEGGIISFIPLFILYSLFLFFLIKNRGKKDKFGYDILLYVIVFQMLNSMKSGSIADARVLFFLMGYYACGISKNNLFKNKVNLNKNLIKRV